MTTKHLQTEIIEGEYQDIGAGALVPVGAQQQRQQIITAITRTAKSPMTRRKYAANLNDFLDWHQQQGQPALTRELILEYMEHLKAAGVGSLSPRLSAIKKLAYELMVRGVIDQLAHSTIDSIPNKLYTHEGRHTGNWLTLPEAQELLKAPDLTTNRGTRDRAILAVFLGCGLRRSELATLTVEHLQQRAGRWVILDIIGKRDKRRTVPMTDRTREIIMNWCELAGIESGLIFQPVDRWDHIGSGGMSDHSIWRIVKEYAPDLAPHDLRRTFAALARKGGAELDTIQSSLGHSSPETTQRYIGRFDQFERGAAACDNTGLL